MLSQGPKETEYYIKLKIANKKYKAFENKKTTGFSDEIKINRFLVCGSGGSGTSLLRGLLNAHSKLTVLFENMRYDQWDGMADAANELNVIWGNKINVQKCNSNKIIDKMILNFVEKYHMIWIVRRPAHFDWKLKKAYRTVWNRINQLYWDIKDKYPDRIINVSFEDLVLWPEAELRRLCSFLHIEYENKMLKGTAETGHGSYKHDKLLTEKAFK